MKLKDFIGKLNEFDDNLEVTITDGYEGIVYSLNKAQIKLFKELDGTYSIDIGIGGCQIE